MAGMPTTPPTPGRETTTRSRRTFRYDTYNHMQKNGADSKWEIAVPNGMYSSDAHRRRPQRHRLGLRRRIGRPVALSGTPSGDVRWFTSTTNVVVTERPPDVRQRTVRRKPSQDAVVSTPAATCRRRRRAPTTRHPQAGAAAASSSSPCSAWRARCSAKRGWRTWCERRS